jgi:hypothetical protein
MVLGVTLHRFGLKRIPGYGAGSDTAPGGPRRGSVCGAKSDTTPVWTQEDSWIWCWE